MAKEIASKSTTLSYVACSLHICSAYFHVSAEDFIIKRTCCGLYQKGLLSNSYGSGYANLQTPTALDNTVIGRMCVEDMMVAKITIKSCLKAGTQLNSAMHCLWLQQGMMYHWARFTDSHYFFCNIWVVFIHGTSGTGTRRVLSLLLDVSNRVLVLQGAGISGAAGIPGEKSVV